MRRGGARNLVVTRTREQEAGGDDCWKSHERSRVDAIRMMAGVQLKTTVFRRGTQSSGGTPRTAGNKKDLRRSLRPSASLRPLRSHIQLNASSASNLQPSGDWGCLKLETHRLCTLTLDPIVADSLPLVKGTLDILVLKALSWTPMHGFEITQWVEGRSGGALDVRDSALYQALYRLEEREFVAAEWGVTENNQRARYYKLTRSGRSHLVAETARWVRYAATMTGILTAAAGPA